MTHLFSRAAVVCVLALGAAECTRAARNGGTVTAVIDGVPFVSSSVEVISANGTLQLNAIGPNARVLILQTADHSATGTVYFKPFLVANYGAVTEGAQATWTTFSAGASGSLRYASASASRAAGTFSFVAPAVASSGASGVRTITDGKFDVRF